MDLTLVIMAAGMGSRFGGIKQIEPVGPNGELIIDFSVFDAKQAGFNKVVFIIKKDIEQAFKESIFNRISKQIDAEYVFQEPDDLPKGIKFPEGRVKPLGTGQAILAARHVVKTPFMIINADDFYGRDAFVSTANFLKSLPANSKFQYSSVFYKIGETVSEQGSVSRGIFQIGCNGKITDIKEVKEIYKNRDKISYTENGKEIILPQNAPVSMTAFGLTPDVFELVSEKFPAFFEENKDNLLKAEFVLPGILGELLREKKVSFKIFESKDKWFGFTYKEDKEIVMSELKNMIAQGRYPSQLWN